MRRLWENPVFYRALVSERTGRRVGVVFGLLHLVVAGGLIYFLATALESQVACEIGRGRYLYVLLQTGIFGLLVTVIPLQLAGFIDRIRKEGCFDEVVVSGIPPLRIAAGGWGVGAIFAGLFLATTLPYAVFCLYLGGLGLGDLLTGYAIQAAYANVVILGVVAAAILGGTRAAIYGGLGLFATVGLVGGLAIPSAVAHLGPVRLFLAPILRAEAFSSDPQDWLLYGPPSLYGRALHDGIYAPALWILLAAGLLALLAAGPSHAFLPGLNSFGTVTTARRIGRRRRRLSGLVRRIEVAFLYRNRPPWVERRAFAIRSLGKLAFFVLIEVLGVGIAYAPVVVGAGRVEMLAALALCLIVAPVFLLDLAFAEGAGSRDRVERIGPFRHRRVVWWDLVFVLGILLGILLALGPVGLEPLRRGWGTSLGRRGTEEFLLLFGQGLSVLVPVLIVLHLFARLLSPVSPLSSHVVFLGVLAAGIGLLLPSLLLEPLVSVGAVGKWGSWLLAASPVPALTTALSRMDYWATTEWLAFLWFQGGVILGLLTACTLLGGMARRARRPEVGHVV